MYTLSNLNFMGKSPKIDPDAFVAPRVFLAGDVRISRYASLWPGVVARGDVNYISIGECSNVQDLVCLHVADDFPCHHRRLCYHRTLRLRTCLHD